MNPAATIANDLGYSPSSSNDFGVGTALAIPQAANVIANDLYLQDFEKKAILNAMGYEIQTPLYAGTRPPVTDGNPGTTGNRIVPKSYGGNFGSKFGTAVEGFFNYLGLSSLPDMFSSPEDFSANTEWMNAIPPLGFAKAGILGAVGGLRLLPRGPRFINLSAHALKHEPDLRIFNTQKYLNQALGNIKNGTRFLFRHDGQTKAAFITKIGDDSYLFTSTTKSGKVIFTHMPVDSKYLSNIGITLPKGLK